MYRDDGLYQATQDQQGLREEEDLRQEISSRCFCLSRHYCFHHFSLAERVVLTRKLAEVVVDDTTVFPIGGQYLSFMDQPLPADASKEHNCIPDEHYVQTILAETEYRENGAVA
ncbi:hypothetical protein FNV43_RR01637 [Rhamnella rubrinervis]|uniref:Uncharacterized protein n=1 Tax=Rhamnella rubrinervis TaxID=2594499 RepID=A0A8K0MTG8_9ROSA|nr:hypothetical protein FNV43_RR01637 [Rhamnella rubrinervis]